MLEYFRLFSIFWIRDCYPSNYQWWPMTGGVIAIFIYLMHCSHYSFSFSFFHDVYWVRLQIGSWVGLEVSIRWLNRQVKSRVTALNCLVRSRGANSSEGKLFLLGLKQYVGLTTKPYSFTFVVCYSFTYD